MDNPTIVVEIPRITEHAGYVGNLVKVRISANCPTCGQPRAEKVWRGLSYDGSMRLSVDSWSNSCGHVDKYSAVRAEGEVVDYSTPSITEALTSSQE